MPVNCIYFRLVELYSSKILKEILNLYVADLSTQLETMCDYHQYADDTTIYTSSHPQNFKRELKASTPPSEIWPTGPNSQN